MYFPNHEIAFVTISIFFEYDMMSMISVLMLFVLLSNEICV
jgi:hypothetical protein